MRNGTLLYAQSGGVTAVINATAAAVIEPLSMTAQLTALNDKGPEIPSCAAVALAAKIARGYLPEPGARPCVGEISVDEYMAAINDPQNLDLSVHFSDGLR